MSSRVLALLAMAVLVYVGAYVIFPHARTEVWQRDQPAYVTFPDGGSGALLYYAWRPLSYVDGALTGMRFHIGPHR
jgi:hypothetical protein